MRVQLGASAVLAVAGVAVAGYLAWRISRATDGLGAAIGDKVAAVADAVNPASSGNVINQGVSAIGGAIVSDSAGPGMNADGSWSLGGWLYDVTHTDPLRTY